MVPDPPASPPVMAFGAVGSAMADTILVGRHEMRDAEAVAAVFE